MVAILIAYCVYLVAWFVASCLVGVGIGSVFRARPVAGFLLGLFFGPIGWLLVIGLEDRRPKCSECGGVIVKGSKRCQNCGVIFSKPRMATYVEPESDDKADEVMDWLK